MQTISGIPGVTLQKALELRNGREIIPNKLADRIITDPECKILNDASPFRTGTFCAYNNAHGRRLGGKIEFDDVVFLVPERYQTSTYAGHVLVSENRHLTAYEEHGKTFIVGEVTHVQKFPRSEGRYKTDPNTGIPTNEAGVSWGPTSRYALVRDGPWAGLIDRSYTCREFVCATNRPDSPGWGLGVVFISREALEQFKQLEKLLPKRQA